eukprot:snap_masked-scaffold_20-processed-gene-5.52-mRNA-1 protein AED:1.00 eAED:1.00 QI:0/0/0/0/1/1/2/0/115
MYVASASCLNVDESPMLSQDTESCKIVSLYESVKSRIQLSRRGFMGGIFLRPLGVIPSFHTVAIKKSLISLKKATGKIGNTTAELLREKDFSFSPTFLLMRVFEVLFDEYFEPLL